MMVDNGAKYGCLLRTSPAFEIRATAGFTLRIFAIFLAADVRRAVPSTRRNQSLLVAMAMAFIVDVVIVVVASNAVVVVIVVVIVVASGAVVVVVVVVVDALAAFFFSSSKGNPIACVCLTWWLPTL
jgi:hypothetical protein